MYALEYFGMRPSLHVIAQHEPQYKVHLLLILHG